MFFASETVELHPPVRGVLEAGIGPYQRGRVRCMGSSWPAQFYQRDCETTVTTNQQVNVVARRGITLLVIPLESA
jgi:membrane protein implicated in regulation of membrane protease activity